VSKSNISNYDVSEYDFHLFEKKWQRYWSENKTFATQANADGSQKKKCYILDMFPYPSGSGLHIGHPVGYTGSDILARFRRHQGYNVLHPMGYDSFGLPAEQHAIATGQHPQELTALNCDRFTEQLKNLGFSYDWDREIRTSDSSYYQWTQSIFLHLYNSWFDNSTQSARPIAELHIPEKIQEQGDLAVQEYMSGYRLAYLANALVNWCPALGTVLANEEVIEGKSERGGHDVIRKPMRQWFLRITAYSERLLADLEDLDWPESIKDQQRYWIGKRHGTNVVFSVVDVHHLLTAFTTRVDTLFGVTFVVISPEHPLVLELTKPDNLNAVTAYCDRAMRLSDLDRTMENNEKTGVQTGSFVVNPITKKKIPIYVGDYVLMNVGTGVVMGVPAHDDRDFEFAKKYALPIVPVVQPALTHKLHASVIKSDVCWTDAGTMIPCTDAVFIELKLAEISNEEAKVRITSWLETKNLGLRFTTYRLRDWLFSRQRYWGEPIPLIHWEDGTTTSLNEKELPLLLPPTNDFQPTDSGESPLARVTDWLKVACPVTGKKGTRETNTMPQWAGSCWYYLRFIDPHNNTRGWNKELEEAWMPVDLYIGGTEHAVLHLLYSRFWHKVLFDLGQVSTKEPFQKLFNQGMIVSHAFKDSRGALVPIDEVKEQKDGTYLKTESGEEVQKIVAKMSKSLRNVVNPDDIIALYGADTLRIFLMFMAPLEASKPWNSDAIVGCHRFLKRYWALITNNQSSKNRHFTSEDTEEAEVKKSLHKAIKKVTADNADLRYNTAISTLMELLNQLQGKPISKKTSEQLTLLISPYAPHAAEELWLWLGHTGGISFAPWPVWDDAFLQESVTAFVVQVGGKKRAILQTSTSASDEEVHRLVVEAMKNTSYEVQPSDKIIVVRDRETQAPKLASIIQKK
jgi:leucyl-tRNA synthetase